MNLKKVGLMVVAVGVIGAGVASAQQPGNPPGGPDDRPGRPGMFGGHMFGERGGMGVLRGALEVISAETGLEPQDIAAQIRDGATLAEIITANGSTVEAVTTALVAEAQTRLDEAVTAGRITQERADEMLANLETAIPNLLNGELRERFGRGGGRLGDRVQSGVLELAAEQTGLTIDDLRAQLRDGAELSDILTSSGVDITTFINDVVAQAQTRLDEAVAAGQITQERADELLSTLRDRLTERLTATPAL